MDLIWKLLCSFFKNKREIEKYNLVIFFWIFIFWFLYLVIDINIFMFMEFLFIMVRNVFILDVYF